MSPSLCPDLGAVPPSVGGLEHIPPPQHLGTTRSLGHSHLERPFPAGHRERGTHLCAPAWPVRSGLPGGLWSRTLSHRAPAACPARLCSPFPRARHRGVPSVTPGSRLPPSPAPIPRGTGHTVPHSSLWFGADVPGQPGVAGSPSCSQTAHEERRTPLCTECGTPQSPQVSPYAVRTLSGTERGGRAGESSSRTFCGS